MMAKTKICPRCAERVRAAALVCRHCGHEFTTPLDLTKEGDAPAEEGPTDRRVNRWLVAGAGLALLIVALLVGYAMTPSVDAPEKRTASARTTETTLPADDAATRVPELAVGSSLEWDPAKMPGDTVRRVGDLLVTISARRGDETVTPVVVVRRGAETLTLVGEEAGEGYTHDVAAVRLDAGGPAMVMLQSYSGGAHCCTAVQLAGDVDGRLGRVDMGTWDGDGIALPTDVDGDGRSDFVVRDEALLYAFSSYASSMAPPRVLNVVNGRVADVTARAAFRRLFDGEIEDARRACSTGESGDERNGACAGYAVDAARLGHLDEAWPDIVRFHSDDEEWIWPTGCAIAAKDGCPEARQITYPGYLEALAAFLVRGGYAPRGWRPPASTTDASPPETEADGGGAERMDDGAAL